MIPAAATMEHINEMPGEETEFSIGDAAWVMESLADLYSDIETATAREYSTNAHDANVEAGYDGPIEVSLPSMMDPYFVVRDYGLGMSVDTLQQVYTKFGTSTKRESNDFNGMLGFGSKVGAAYTNTFTVTSVHNGHKTVAVIYKKPTGIIAMKVVAQMRVFEPSGTEVRVPVHNWQEFSTKARNFYKFWLPGRVKVDGVEPEHNVGEKITDNLYYSTHWRESYVVMGNVPYRIINPEALFQNTKLSSLNFVAYVDNGDVEFSKSREDLKYTDRTKATLHQIIKDFETQIVSEAKKDIESATNHFDAYCKWSEWTGRLGKRLFDELEFDGDKFMEYFPINGMRYQPSSYYRGSTYRINQWEVGQMDKTLIITEFDPDLTSTHKSKAREYLKLKGISANFIIFTSVKEIKNPWVDQTRLVSWEDVKAAIPKAPRKPRQVNPNIPGRVSGSWDYWTKDAHASEKPLPKDTKNVYWISVQDNKTYDVRQALAQLESDAVVLIVPANRQAKLLRENPQVKEFLKWARSQVVLDGASLLTDDAKKSLRIGYQTREWLRKIEVDKVDDPAFKATADLIANGKVLTKRYDHNMALAQSLRMWYDVKKHNIEASDDSLVNGYPLLESLRTGYHYNVDKKHLYIYLNAAYAAKKKGN